MKIVYKTGDMLEAPERIICHGCNAQGSMGAGIALAIRKRYPTVFAAYRKAFESQGKKLGLAQIIWVDCPDGRTVINAVTQETYGRDPNVIYVSYPAIERVIAEIDAWAASKKAEIVVAFPKIGAGLANGDWAVIERIIEDGSRHFQPVVYTL